MEVPDYISGLFQGDRVERILSNVENDKPDNIFLLYVKNGEVALSYTGFNKHKLVDILHGVINSLIEV